MSTESGKVVTPYDASCMRVPSAQLDAARVEATRTLLANINQAPASFYATRSGFPFRDWKRVPILTGGDLAAEIAANAPFGRLALRGERLLRAGLATAVLPGPT